MATPQAIADACAVLIKAYGTRAKAQLGDDLAKELLFLDLEGYSNEELAHAMTLMRRGQENVFADGQSIYAVILKWAKEARSELTRQRRFDHDVQQKLDKEEELKRLAATMTPEKMAINKLRIQLLREGRMDEAKRFAVMPYEEAIKLVPAPMLLAAKEMWQKAHAGHFSKLLDPDRVRLPAPPPCPMIPEST